MMTATTLWFVTDLHGSSRCFRKFLNAIDSRKRPDVLVIGGDITGKVVVPVINRASSTWCTAYGGEELRLDGAAELERFSARLADRGDYAWPCDAELLDEVRRDAALEEQVITRLRSERLEEWVEIADRKMRGTGRRIFINPGNDDPLAIDEVLDASEVIVRPEGKVVEIDARLTMISCGYANLTPWLAPRDTTEDDLLRRIADMAERVPDPGRSIFNLHAPPFDTALDQAPALDREFKPRLSGVGVEMKSVGSTAVRESILRYQPLVGLHGHIHEQHTYARLGRTLCFNPGSEYETGHLRGVLARFVNGSLAEYALTREEMAVARP